MCEPKPPQLETIAPPGARREALPDPRRLFAHAELLGLLVHLALGQQGGGNHHFHLLHLLHGAGSQGAHGGADAAQQVLGAVIKTGGAAQDLLQAAGGAHLDAVTMPPSATIGT